MSHSLAALQVAAALTSTPPVDVRTLGLTDDVLEEVYFELLRSGLIRADGVAAGAHDIAPLPERRADLRLLGRRYPESGIQRAILTRVQELNDRGSIGAEELDRACALVEGALPQNAKQTLRQLEADGYIKGTWAGGGELIRPELTSAGARALNDDLWPLGGLGGVPAVVSQNHIGQQFNVGSGSHVAASQGTSSTATVNHNEGVSQEVFAHIVHQLRNISSAPELSSEDRSLLQDDAATLENAGDGIRTDPSRMQRLLRRLGDGLIDSGARSAVQALVAMVPTMIG